jgi:hypothetical protein
MSGQTCQTSLIVIVSLATISISTVQPWNRLVLYFGLIVTWFLNPNAPGFTRYAYICSYNSHITLRKMLGFVCMCGMHIYRLQCIPTLFKSSNRIRIKIECKKWMLYSWQELYVLWNGAIVFAVSLILCTRKLITKIVLAFNLHFQHIGLSLQESNCTIWKSVKFESRLRFCI